MRHLDRVSRQLERLDAWVAAYLRTPPGWVFAAALVLGTLHAGSPAGLL